MELRLGDDEAAELRRLLSDTLRDLSSEIADTDNAEFRRNLRARRQLLERVHQELGTST